MPNQELWVQKKAKNKEKRELKKEICEEKQKSNLIEGIKSLLLLCNSGLKLFFFIRFLCLQLQACIFSASFIFVV